MDKGKKLLLKSEIKEKKKIIQLIYEKVKERINKLDNEAEIESMGYKLHNLYGAYEELFETIANFFENMIEGARYHADLLFRMKIEIEGIRPNLLSNTSYKLLNELRRFRHLFRHAYNIELDKEQIKKIIDTAIKVEKLFNQELSEFMKKL